MQNNVIKLTDCRLPKSTGQFLLTQAELRMELSHYCKVHDMTIKPQHVKRFLNMNYRSLRDMERRLAAYKVFGDLGYGD